MATLPFTGGFYALPDTSVSNQRCVNLWTHISEGASETQEQLLGVQGITTLGDTSYGETRGSIVFQNELYRVDGQNFVKIDVNNTVTNYGTISGFGLVSIAENGESICIVDPNGHSYFYDTTNGLVQITDADYTSFGVARSVTYSDGFFLFNTDTVLFQSSLSTVNKGQNFNALEFEDAEQFTDDLVRVIASQGNVYAFGALSYEIYRLKPSSTVNEFAFQRVTAQNNERGLYGRFNVFTAESALYFIGGGSNEAWSVWELRGATPKKISTDAIDILINDSVSSNLNLDFGWHYAKDGQFFRGFTFSSTSIVYNSRTQRWCEFQSGGTGWSVKTIDAIYSRLMMSDDSGKFGEMDSNVYTQWGETVFDYFTTQPFANGQAAFGVQTLEAICQAGVGNSDSESPTIAMSFSRDGVSFGNERYRDLGEAGQRSKRQVWRNIGRMDDSVVFRFAFAEPCRKAFIGLQADFI